MTTRILSVIFLLCSAALSMLKALPVCHAPQEITQTIVRRGLSLAKDTASGDELVYLSSPKDSLLGRTKKGLTKAFSCGTLEPSPNNYDTPFNEDGGFANLGTEGSRRMPFGKSASGGVSAFAWANQSGSNFKASASNRVPALVRVNKSGSKSEENEVGKEKSKGKISETDCSESPIHNVASARIQTPRSPGNNKNYYIVVPARIFIHSFFPLCRSPRAARRQSRIARGVLANKKKIKSPAGKGPIVQDSGEYQGSNTASNIPTKAMEDLITFDDDPIKPTQNYSNEFSFPVLDEITADFRWPRRKIEQGVEKLG